MGDGGTILVTANGGQKWEEQTSPTQNTLWSVAFANAQQGWAVGSYGTLVTITGIAGNLFDPSLTDENRQQLLAEFALSDDEAAQMVDALNAAKAATARENATVERYQTRISESADTLTATEIDTVFVNTQISRIGVMAFLLFFVTILVNLYRYSMRMAAFYDSRADSLLLMLAWGKDAPDNFDFGKQAKNPLELSADVAAKLLDAARRR